jgi:hypothetical protein
MYPTYSLDATTEKLDASTHTLRFKPVGCLR